MWQIFKQWIKNFPCISNAFIFRCVSSFKTKKKNNKGSTKLLCMFEVYQGIFILKYNISVSGSQVVKVYVLIQIQGDYLYIFIILLLFYFIFIIYTKIFWFQMFSAVTSKNVCLRIKWMNDRQKLMVIVFIFVFAFCAYGKMRYWGSRCLRSCLNLS